MENDTMATTERTVLQTNTESAEEKAAQNASRTTSRAPHNTMAENPVMDTTAFITLVRRAPALTALREQPLDRRDLETCLDVSKPTVHRLTRTLSEMSLVERSNGVFTLTGLGKAIADVVAEFTRNVETAYRLTPLLETIQDRYLAFDVTAFADATVTTAEPSDPYRPVQRYCSLIEETRVLRGFDTTTLSPQHLDAVHRRVCDGMETELVYPPAVAAHLLSTHPEQMAEMVESGFLDVRAHADISHGLVLFDERVGVGSYCKTTGALQAFIDTDEPAAYEWAETIYDAYWTEAERFEMHPNPSLRPV